MSRVVKPKRLHHAIPVHYLKGFAELDGSSYIWEYEKHKPFDQTSNIGTVQNPYRKIIRKAGAFKDLYAVKDTAIADYNTYEEKIKAVEDLAIPILKKARLHLRHDNLTMEEKLTFSRYILLMLKRVPAEQERANHLLWPAALNNVEEKTARMLDDYAERTDFSDLSKLAIFEKRKAEAGEIINQFRKAIPDEVRLNAMLGESDLNFAGLVSSMTWQFLVAPEREEFFTGDNPIFYFRELGINKNISELSFPLSRKVCLVASWRVIPEGYFRAEVSQVETINERTAERAGRYLYAASASKAIYDFTLRNYENTNLIRLIYPPYYFYKNIPSLG